MAIEMELKAWADDPDATRSTIAAIAREKGPFDKDDAYWLPVSGGSQQLGSGIRIRKERPNSTHGVVNYKRKEVRDGMEVNDEREFTVSDVSIFAEMLQKLGLVEWIRKRKIGQAWTLDGATIELSELVGLGFFVEIEILAEQESPDLVAETRARLLSLLRRIGIEEDKIEPRYYTEMLAEKMNLKKISE